MKKLALIAVVIFFSASSCYALHTATHKAINEYIAKNNINSFSLNFYLQNQAGIQAGINELFDGEEIFKWIRDGGVYEDIPYWYMPYLRSVNHFHNPVTKEGFDGIWGQWVLHGESSLQWSQEPIGTQSPGGYYSWHDVRDYYYKALTETDKRARAQNFANTFRGIGQLMHLVEDLSVPEHTRDDGHYFLYMYEDWAAIKITSKTLPDFPPIFDPVLLKGPSQFAFYDVPIAGLFDTSQYNGTNPDITLQSNIGLSEYTNANFLSPDTMFSSDFPYPDWSSAVLYDWTDPLTGRKTTYLEKLGRGETGGNGQAGNGEHVDHLAAARWGYKLLPSWLQQGGMFLRLDDNCYFEYASKLIPRAVGYAAALMDYFFRGAINISVPEDGLYSMIDAAQPGFTSIKLIATNNTANGKNMTNGTIQLVVKYKVAHIDPFQPGPVETGADFSYIVVPEENNVNALDNGSPTELNFDLRQTPIPLWATDVYLQVVFRGTLGNEDDAVAVGFKDIGEPTPIDLFSNTDMICINGSWYVAGSQEALAQVDANNHGIADYPDEGDVYRHDPEDIYILFSPYSETTYRIASPTFYDFKVSGLTPANLMRPLYILSDYQFDDTSHVHWVKADPDDNWPVYDQKYLHIDYSIKRQTEYSEDSGLCGSAPSCYFDYYPDEATSFPYYETPEFYTFRGALMWWGAPEIYTNYPYPDGSQCSYDSL